MNAGFKHYQYGQYNRIFKCRLIYNKMRRLFKFRYPKLTLLVAIVILAYIIFSDERTSLIIGSFDELGYLSSFLFGLLFSFGFTTPFSVGYFITAQTQNVFISAIIGGFGALLADLFIFKLIKISFMDEFRRLEKTQPLKEMIYLADKDLSIRVRHYLLYILAGLIISSPLPDELGITMLAGLSHIKAGKLALISFIFNTLGILLMLLI